MTTRAVPIACALLLLLETTRAAAQMRPGAPPVLAPAPRAQPAPIDHEGRFAAQYAAAQSPRLMLFWNAVFDDSTEASREEIERSRRDETVRTQRVVGAGTPSWLNERNRNELESRFRQRLLAAGVRLVDRATSIRFTQAQRDREGVDPKLIEADAVLAKADLLLQIVAVPDGNAPLLCGFRISITDVKRETEIATLYTAGAPDASGSGGHYVATTRGFEWSEPGPAAVTAAEVAGVLADSVFDALATALARR